MIFSSGSTWVIKVAVVYMGVQISTHFKKLAWAAIYKQLLVIIYYYTIVIIHGKIFAAPGF